MGIKAVQEAKSGCEYYDCDIPVVFTNNTFSKAAINLAKSTNVELWDQEMLYHYLKKAKLLTKSLPFYYPLLSLLITILLGYGYYCYHYQYLLIMLVISCFFLISIIIKIYKDKQKAPLLLEKPVYNLHDYHDTM